MDRETARQEFRERVWASAPITTRPPPPVRAMFIPSNYRDRPFIVEVALLPDGTFNHQRTDGIYVVI